jgi:hypothetical protein
VKECQKQLEEALQVTFEFDKSLTEAIKREQMLQAEIDSFILKLEMKKKIVEQLKESSHRTLILRLSKTPIGSTQEIQEPTFQWMHCALCIVPYCISTQGCSSGTMHVVLSPVVHCYVELDFRFMRKGGLQEDV